jgi:hypothetical protein
VLARDDFAGVVEQLEQDAQRLLRQSRRALAARDVPRHAIDRPAVELQVRLRRHAPR